MDRGNFTDLMIDIETLGTEQTAVILSIAAVAFNRDTGESDNDFFYSGVNANMQMKQGRTVSMETIKWWISVNGVARDLAFDGTDLLNKSIERLNVYILDKCIDHVRVWAKGPGFDCSIIKNAAGGEGNMAWFAKDERDVRTYIEGYELITSVFKNKRPHYPVDDAIVQLNQVCAVYEMIHK